MFLTLEISLAVFAEVCYYFYRSAFQTRFSKLQSEFLCRGCSRQFYLSGGGSKILTGDVLFPLQNWMDQFAKSFIFSAFVLISFFVNTTCLFFSVKFWKDNFWNIYRESRKIRGIDWEILNFKQKFPVGSRRKELSLNFLWLYEEAPYRYRGLKVMRFFVKNSPWKQFILFHEFPEKNIGF